MTNDFETDCYNLYYIISSILEGSRSGTNRQLMYKNHFGKYEDKTSYSITLGHTIRKYMSPTRYRDLSDIYQNMYKTEYLKHNQELYDIIMEFGKKYIPDFDYSDIQINNNWGAPPHKDKGNIGKSHIIALGDFTGGELVIENEKYDINNKFLEFDGVNNTHYVMPHQGNRLSVVYYNPRIGIKI